MIPLKTISELGPDAESAILDTILKFSSIGLAVYDSDLRYLWVNPVYARYSGVSAAKHVGRTVSEVLGNKAWAERKPLMEQALSRTASVDMALTIPEQNNRQSSDTFRTSYFPVDLGQNIFGVLSMIVDQSVKATEEVKILKKTIGEIKSQEQRLLEQQDRLELALSSGKLGTWQLSLVKEELIDASAICKASFGFAHDEAFTYKDLVQIIHPDDLPNVLRMVDISRTDGSTYQGEYRCIWRDGTEHWISAIAQPTFDESGHPATLIGISQDISERKQAEREKSELLAKIRDFSTTQAQFLRDVLASVTDGKLQLCQRQTELPGRGSVLGASIRLTADSGLNVLRNASKHAAKELSFSDERWQDLITAVSEAGMNAVVHAGGGIAWVCTGKSGCVQVWVTDKGKGIELENLPRATLEKGYTTTGTMGHGMKMMLQTADRVWLLTGPSGTTLVIEQDREPLKREWT